MIRYRSHRLRRYLQGFHDDFLDGECRPSTIIIGGGIALILAIF